MCTFISNNLNQGTLNPLKFKDVTLYSVKCFNFKTMQKQKARAIPRISRKKALFL
jgi:hypothetical protein